MTLGDIIYKYRKENHFTMEYVANLCGITKGYVAMLEKNVNSKTGRPVKPTVETISKVCKGLNMDINEVFELLDDDYEIIVPAVKKNNGVAADITLKMIENPELTVVMEKVSKLNSKQLATLSLFLDTLLD